MKHFLLTTLLCGMALSATRAQNSDIESYVPILPPTVASFMKNIEHPVGLYHGNPEIAHTLYTLKDGSIELPITLRYNASGIKVDEEASWVGLGWNLDMGGMVVQNIVGAPDSPYEFNQCLDYYPSMPFHYYKEIVYSANDKNKYSSFFPYAMEGRLQPDVFCFAYPGGSGKFFIDYRDNSIHRIDDKEPLKIEKSAEGWRITTDKGICHTFGKRVSSKRDWYDNGDTYYLTSSTYPNGQTVTYEYTFKTVTAYYPRDRQTLLLQPASGVKAYEHVITDGHHSTVETTEGTLTAIHTTNYTVTFVNGNREDLENAFRLDEIKIVPRSNGTAWGNPQKRFKFSYDYFKPDMAGSHWNDYLPAGKSESLNKRLKLLSVYESDAAGAESGKLAFDYYGTTLPHKGSCAVDYWGYYNGQTSNEGLIPQMKYLLTDQTSQSWVNRTGTALRAYSFSHCVNGMLKRITYPTKGYMEYTYEPHEFSSSTFIPTVEELGKGGGGVVTRTVESRNTPSDSNSAIVETARGAQVNIDFRIERGLNTWREMEGCRYLLEHCPTGGTYTTVKDVDLTSFGSEESSNYVTSYSFSSAGGSYRLTIWLPEAIGNQWGSMTKHGVFRATISAPRPDITERGYNYGGGVRVSKVDYRDGASDDSGYTLSYDYPNPNNHAISFVPPVFHRYYSGLKYAQMTYDQWGNPNSVDEGQNGTELEVSNYNFCSAPYSAIGATVGYSQVIERRSDAGETRYYFYNRNEVNIFVSYQIPRPENGLLLEMYQYDTSGKLVRSETNTYDSQRVHFFYGVSIQDKFNRTPEFYPNLVERYRLMDFGAYDRRFFTLLYALESSHTSLTRKEVVQDGVSTVYDYQYDNHSQAASETLTDSNGKTVETRYSYPYDFDCEPYTDMAEKHMYAYPVEVKHMADGKLADCHLTTYQTYGPLSLPQSQSRGSIAVPTTDKPAFSCKGTSDPTYPVADVTFLKYDTQGNPVHLRAKGEDIVYVWGYNYQYPVAEIRLSNYEDVKKALGCTPESLSAKAVPDTEKLNLLRTKLPEALVTTYTYRPLTGMTSMTAPNGEVTKFEYDTFGRLKKALDGDGKTIEEYEYHYKN